MQNYYLYKYIFDEIDGKKYFTFTYFYLILVKGNYYLLLIQFDGKVHFM